MALEDEYKYVLDDDGHLESRLLNAAQAEGYTVMNLKQAYLLRGARVREYTYLMEDGLDVRNQGKVERVFTYKHDLPGRNAVVEIETHVSDEDFSLLWEGAQPVIEKTRYVFITNKRFRWELDFFRSGCDTYLTMAECEVYDGSGRPSALPDFVRDNLLFEVPDGDKRFVNRKLADVEEVKKLIIELKD